MEPLKLKIPNSFFLSESKCNYFVSSKMKHVWAVELDLLNQAIKVLEKNNIKYFLGGGSLLGAIRHKGFIPWDDDIDIFLPRNDYNKLTAIGPKVFSYPYHFQDEYTEPGIMYGHSKLRNSSTTGIIKGFLEDIHGVVTYNQGIFIDFFPLDNIPDNTVEKDCWIKDIKDIAVDTWKYKKYIYRSLPPNNNEEKLRFEKIKEFLDQIGDPNYYFRKYEATLGMFANTNTKKSCIYSFYRTKQEDRWTFFNNDFDEIEYVSFEMLRVPVPKNYRHMLETSFGNWEKMVQESSVHDSCYFDIHHPWTFYVDEIHGINKQKVLSLL